MLISNAFRRICFLGAWPSVALVCSAIAHYRLAVIFAPLDSYHIVKLLPEVLQVADVGCLAHLSAFIPLLHYFRGRARTPFASRIAS